MSHSLRKTYFTFLSYRIGVTSLFYPNSSAANVENNRPKSCSYLQRNTCQGTSVCQNISILGNDCRKLIISVSLTGISPLAHSSIPVATSQYVSCLIQRTKRWAGRKICFLHDRTENACTVSTSRCPIQTLRKVF